MTPSPLTLCVALLAVAACDNTIIDPPDPPATQTDAALRQTLARWGTMPIGPMPAQSPARVALGRALFFDKILSGNRDVSCATCHNPAFALADGRSLPVGTGGAGIGPDRTMGTARQFVPRSAPTLLNAGLGLPYMFWDGRLSGFFQAPFTVFPDTVLLTATNILAAQATLPVLDRLEMRGEPGDVDVFGNPNELAALDDDDPQAIWRAVMDRLLAIPEYEALLAAAFPGRPVGLLRFQDAAEAIAAFQMEALTATDSPFDRFLDRDDNAMSPQAKDGARLFFGEAQCSGCHSGPFLGGQGFANVGAPQLGPGMAGRPPLDLGRGEFEEFEFYRFAFRIPPLRNVELTAPYMHSGAFPTLEAVVEHYDDVTTSMRGFDISQLAPEYRDSYHGDDASVGQVMETLDFRLRQRQGFTAQEKANLAAFLRSLTDPAAGDLEDLAPASVPSGLPVR